MKIAPSSLILHLSEATRRIHNAEQAIGASISATTPTICAATLRAPVNAGNEWGGSLSCERVPTVLCSTPSIELPIPGPFIVFASKKM